MHLARKTLFLACFLGKIDFLQVFLAESCQKNNLQKEYTTEIKIMAPPLRKIFGGHLFFQNFEILNFLGVTYFREKISGILLGVTYFSGFLTKKCSFSKGFPL